ATKGAYHVRSTNPVTVYQFNSLEYQKAGVFSYSNDASLLLPTNTWRTSYYAAAWEPTSTNPSEVAVTARQDGTTEMIKANADTQGGGGARVFGAGPPQPIMLNQGDVLDLTSIAGDRPGPTFMPDKPIQLIGGHYCADVPND